MTIHLFSRARELAGAGSVDMSPVSTVAALRAELAACIPALHDLLLVSRIAVNHEFADDSRTLLDSDEVAVIPPVSGG